MIRPQPNSYLRRRRLDYPDGCRSVCVSPAAALAYHEPDSSSSQTQSSNQTGAQTGGIALDKVTINQTSNNSGNSGSSNPHTRNPAENGTATPAAGGAQIVNINSDTNAPAAIAALQQALDDALKTNTNVTGLVSKQLDNSAVAASTLPASSSTFQSLAALASLLGGVWLLWKYFFKKKIT